METTPQFTIADRLKYVHSLPNAGSSPSDRSVKWIKDAVTEKKHKVVGVTVVFDKNDALNHLYSTFNAKEESSYRVSGEPSQHVAKDLTVICDTLMINSYLRLPECNVTIYTRRLVFGEDGVLDTSPSPWLHEKAKDADPANKGTNGADGFHGGDITIYATEVSLPESSKTRKRIIVSGGPGQKGGRGINGDDGEGRWPLQIPVGYPFETKCVEFLLPDTYVKIPLMKSPVMGVSYQWKSAQFLDAGSFVWGDNKFPTNGKDAVAPGKSGHGGNAGRFATNLADLADILENLPGIGAPAADTATGGRRGYPDECYRYDMVLYDHILGGDRSSSAEIKIVPNKTTDGQSYAGEKGRDGVAFDIKLLTAMEAPANAWLHPECLEIALDYARDCFLSGDRTNASRLLTALAREDALLGDFPSHPLSPWTSEMLSRWASAAAEVAVLRQRLEAKLDYFGKPAGHMPLLSLPGALQLYQMETDTALRVLMLAYWVSEKSAKEQDTTRACEDAVKILSSQNQALAADIKKKEQEATDLERRISALNSDLGQIIRALDALRITAGNEASTNLVKKGQIKFAVNMAAALCQVIPVGQPILGGVASAGTSVFDFVTEDKDEKESLDDLKTTFSETVKKYKDAQKEAKDVIATAKKDAEEKAKEAGGKVTPEQYRKLAETKVSTLTTVGKGLGPAVSHLTTAYKAMQIPQSAIDAEIQKLAAKSEEWKEVSKKIALFQEQKAAVVADLLRVTQEVTANYATTTSNAGSIITLLGKKADSQRKLDPDSLRVIADLRRQAELSLIRALYDVTRAVESTTFQPLSVNWSMSAVLEKIITLVRTDEEWTEKNVKGFVEVLKPVFEGLRTQVRSELRNHFSTFKESSNLVDITIDDPDDIAALNASENVKINPLRYELVRPGFQRAMLSDIEVKKIQFEDPANLPEKGDAEISFRIQETGIVRANRTLYGVRSEGEIVTTFTHHFHDGKVTVSEPSDTSEDLLNFFISDGGNSIRNKLARPPAWSDIWLQVSYSGLKNDGREKPKIKSLVLRCKVDAIPTPKTEVVLNVLSNYPGAILHCEGVEGESLGGLYQIFDANSKISLKALTDDESEWEFDKWKVKGSNDAESSERELELVLKQNTQVECLYRRRP